MKTDFFIDSALQEINFWIQREQALKNIQEQLQHPTVQLTQKLLRKANFNQAVFTFEQNSSFDGPLKQACDYNTLMKTFPIELLLKANDLDSLLKAIEGIFEQL